MSMHRRVIFLVIGACLGILAIFFVAQSRQSNQNNGASGGEKKNSVVTTFLPIYIFAANIAGDAATVTNLLPPNTEAHEYAFTPRDIETLSGADLVVYNGLGLDDWVKD